VSIRCVYILNFQYSEKNSIKKIALKIVKEIVSKKKAKKKNGKTFLKKKKLKIIY